MGASLLLVPAADGPAQRVGFLGDAKIACAYEAMLGHLRLGLSVLLSMIQATKV